MTGVTAVTSTAANLLGYAFNVIMSHALGVRGYGQLAALLAVITVAMVPAMALEAAIARRVANGQSPKGLARTAVLVGLAMAAVFMAAAPLLGPVLRVASYSPVLWAAASVVPLTVAFAWQGVLLGARRFLALGLFLVAVQVARVVAGVFAVLVAPSATAALATTTVLAGVFTLALAAWVLRQAPRQSGRPLLPELVHNLAPFLGTLALSSLDLLLARHYLEQHASGIYAAGNLVTKACFWGPGFIALSSYPRFAIPEHRPAALRHSVMLLAAVAGAGLTAAALGAELVPVLLGPGYRPVARLVWLFAADGLALAGVQLAVYAGLAVGDRRIGRLVWLTGFAEVMVICTTLHHSAKQIVAVALLGNVLLVLAAAVLQADSPAAPRSRLDAPYPRRGGRVRRRFLRGGPGGRNLPPPWTPLAGGRV